MSEGHRGPLVRLLLAEDTRHGTLNSARETEVIVGPISLPREVSIASHTEHNPGIGGSEFHSIQVALILRDAGFKVALEVYGAVPKLNGISRIQRNAFLDTTTGVRIITTAMASTISNDRFEDQRIILVSHHPHDGWLKSLLRARLRLAAVVNVGRYQYFSNKVRNVSSLWLPAFTPTPPSNKAQASCGGSYRAGHISSFHPSKGFHIIARGWMRYVNHLKRADLVKMQVIGADTLYNGGDEGPDAFQFPISGAYGGRIKRELVESNPEWKNNIRFEGLVPESPISLIEKWEVAIFNPLGFGEADPIVLQDALSVSTPVIAGTLFGLYDYMRFFPELSAHTSYGIAKRLRQLDENPILTKAVQLRAQELHLQLLERRKRTEKLWGEAISSIIMGSPLAGIEVGTKEPALWCRLKLGSALLAFQNSGSRVLRFSRGLRQF